MPTVDEMFPRRFLSGGDLIEPVVVTISSVAQEKMWDNFKNKDVERWVLRVKGGTKGVLLAKTTAEQITEITGSDNSDDWVGQKIVLYPIEIKVAGEMKVGIRARAVAAPEEEEPLF